MGDPEKDGALEASVPAVWRPTLERVVDSLVRRDSILGAEIPALSTVSADTTQQCQQAIDDYGDVTLISLPDEAWDTSVAQWYGDHWRCLIDLWTEEEGRSDLVLDVSVFENGPGYRFAVHLVYVP